MDISFLKSNRFWVMVVGAVAVYLKAEGIFGENEMNLVTALSAVFVTVRTLDRAAEKMSGDK